MLLYVHARKEHVAYTVACIVTPVWRADHGQCDKTCGICSDFPATFHIENASFLNAVNYSVLGNFDGTEFSQLNCAQSMQGSLCDMDIDECAVDNGGCQHGCVNSWGGFGCTCLAGYTTSVESSFLCSDNNECDINNGGCMDACYNVPGTYSCRCNGWWKRARDQHNCECRDFDSLVRVRFVNANGVTSFPEVDYPDGTVNSPCNVIANLGACAVLPMQADLPEAACGCACEVLFTHLNATNLSATNLTAVEHALFESIV